MNKKKHWSTLVILSLVLLCIILIINNTRQNEDNSVPIIKADNQVNVNKFNAIVNDDIDDTESIQAAINSLIPTGGTVYFPKGEYLVDAVQSVALRGNTTLFFEEGAILKVKPNDKGSHAVFEIHNVDNVKIKGNLKIIGERGEHIGDTGEWGFGLSIRGSKNVYVENVEIDDMWGDAIYIGSTNRQNYSENIVIVNPILNNNRRQGISVVSAINLTILNPVITNTQGTPPAAGIDLEPNNETEKLKDISIINMKSINNIGQGILIHLKYLANSKDHVNIMINNIGGIEDGVKVNKPQNLKGIIKIGNEYKLNSF
ncbi:glycosyl hydrolase family 28-related protein [Oceanobacillus caeni]|uniref:glycosyl hydrolase family 28-related protein n=1 Tax=Oceanobacillus caeni TaxID=405946 RepID=UPI003644F067